MARVKCVMMQRDEDLILEPWLRYYGYLFGYENLTVFDNGSESTDVRRILEQYAAVGVTVVRHFSTVGDWLAKGDLFAAQIKCWDRDCDYDFAIPLDCDEFLMLFTDRGIACGRAEIHAYLDGLIGRVDAFGIGSTSFNLPGRPGWFWPDLGAKTFFAAGTLRTLDHGFHAGTSSESDVTFRTRLSHFHFHHKPHATVLEHARRKLRPFVDVDDPEAIRMFRGPGFHLVRHFFQSETEYHDQFDGKLTIGFPGFANLMAALGVGSDMFAQPFDAVKAISAGYVTVRLPPLDGLPAQEVLFDGPAYLQRYLDVAVAGINPLEHFLFNGYYERRTAFDVRQAGPAPLSWEAARP